MCSLEADTRNAASGRVLEKLGFLREGTLRENSYCRWRYLGFVDLWAAPAEWEQVQNLA